MSIRCHAIVSAAFVLLLASVPARAADSPAATDPHLVGAWHSVSIDGDALFFIVHGVEVDFDADGSFTAHIRFTDGETETKTGRYVVHGDHMELSIPSMKATESTTYKIEGKELVFHDESFGITIKVARGKAKDDSGHDLF